VVAPQAPLPLSWSSGFRSSPSFLVEWLSLLSLFLGRVAFAPLPLSWSSGFRSSPSRSRSFFHLFAGLRASPLSNYLKVKLRNRKSRLSKNQFDLTVRKDERFLLDLHLTVSLFHCLLNLFFFLLLERLLIHETDGTRKLSLSCLTLS